jgi:hypothetical protein
MAPPLDGVWATGPFLHNGSVPNIELVLDSSKRPTYWRRVDFDSAHFDEAAARVAVRELMYGHADGRGRREEVHLRHDAVAHTNTGHTLRRPPDDEERRAVLEYLKTL